MQRRARVTRAGRIAAAVAVLATGLAIGGAAQPAAAANTYRITDQASCLAFLSAIGGTGRWSFSDTCEIQSGTLPAGDSMSVGAGIDFRPQQLASTAGAAAFTNRGTVDITEGEWYNAGLFENYGVFSLDEGQMRAPFRNYGTVNVTGGSVFIFSDFANQSGGTVACTNGGVLTTSQFGAPSFSGTIPANCDGIAPKITATGTTPAGDPVASGTWTRDNVTVGFTCNDVFSGVSSCSPSDEWISTFAVVGEAVDGNGNRAQTTFNVRIDQTAPTMSVAATSSSGAPVSLGQATAEASVTVTFTCNDVESGVASCPPPVVYTEPGTYPIAGTTVDNAGNASDWSFPSLIIARNPPTVSCASPGTAWSATNVSIACTASDPALGLANPADASFSLSTNVAAGTETSTATTDSRTVTNNAGLSSVAGPFGPIKVDRKAPSIAITSPTGAPTYLVGQVVNAAYSCADGGSGLASCVGTVPSGSRLDTATAGTKTLTVNAADAVGNTSTASASYSVGYTFRGLFAPVSNVGVQQGTAGKTVPLKWSLSGANGTAITARSTLRSVTFQQVPCPGRTGTPGPVTSASGSLSVSAGEFKYEWKTPRTAGCYTVTITLDSGQTFTATFDLKR